MKIKRFNESQMDGIIGSKVGDIILLDSGKIELKVTLNKNDRFRIVKIRDSSNQNIQEEVKSVNDFVVLELLDKKDKTPIRAHYFSTELSRDINKYNL